MLSLIISAHPVDRGFQAAVPVNLTLQPFAKPRTGTKKILSRRAAAVVCSAKANQL
jgi:hypothetical protein